MAETNRSKTINEAMKDIAAMEAEGAEVNARLKSYRQSIIKGELGMKIGDFNAAYRLYSLEGPDRDGFLATISEVFNALGVGDQLNWIDATQNASAGAEVEIEEDEDTAPEESDEVEPEAEAAA